MISNGMYIWGWISFPIKINGYTLLSFQSSHFPFRLQRASARPERRGISAVWKLVQLIQQHADLWLNRPSCCARQCMCLHLCWGEASHRGKDALPLSTSHPMLLHEDANTLTFSTVLKEELRAFTHAHNNVKTLLLSKFYYEKSQCHQMNW